MVAPSQRTPADARPAWAAATAATIVRLLVSSTTVMTMPFTIVGENANGFVQSGFASRRYPYANRIAPKVAASAMMNNHIASFLD